MERRERLLGIAEKLPKDRARCRARARKVVALDRSARKRR